MDAPPRDVGLCPVCLHCRIVQTARSTFYLCGRSATDPAFPKYPRLPVVRCAGYEPRPTAGPPQAPPEGSF
jgi:hypothetical protein